MLLNSNHFFKPTQGGGGLPAEDGVVRNNLFSGLTSGIQTINASSSATGTNGAHKASNRIVGGTDRWQGGTSLPQWWEINFGEDQTIYSFRFAAGSGRHPTAYRIESSDDGTTWTERHSVSGIPTLATGEWTTLESLTTPAEAQWWRFFITAQSSTSQIRVAELEFRS